MKKKKEKKENTSESRQTLVVTYCLNVLTQYQGLTQNKQKHRPQDRIVLGRKQCYAFLQNEMDVGHNELLNSGETVNTVPLFSTNDQFLPCIDDAKGIKICQKSRKVDSVAR